MRLRELTEPPVPPNGDPDDAAEGEDPEVPEETEVSDEEADGL